LLQQISQYTVEDAALQSHSLIHNNCYLGAQQPTGAAGAAASPLCSLEQFSTVLHIWYILQKLQLNRFLT